MSVFFFLIYIIKYLNVYINIINTLNFFYYYFFSLFYNFLFRHNNKARILDTNYNKNYYIHNEEENNVKFYLTFSIIWPIEYDNLIIYI